MILSNSALFKALDDKRIIIDPEPSPRDPRTDPTSDWPYNTTSVDLRLGTEITWFDEDQGLNIDLRHGKFKELFSPHSSKRTISEQQPYMLNPGKLVLGNTLERVSLPIQGGIPSLAARVEGKSSYARCGLLVHFTAPTIHAGFDGRITLELINLGKYAISLFANMYICQLIVEEVGGEPIPNPSQFQGQVKPAGA